MKQALLLFTLLYSLCANAQIFLNAEVMQPQCFGDLGAITTDPFGGFPPYNFQWSTGETTSDIEDLTAGIYSLTVTDNNGSQAWESWTIEVSNTQLYIEANLQNPFCNMSNGNAEGSIEVIVFGGAAPYEYEWSDFTFGTHILYGSEGSYTVTVTDSYGCTIEETWDLESPDELGLSASITDLSCNGNNSWPDGSITITPSGGTPPYTYGWSGLFVNTSSQNQDELLAGTYCVTLTDANQCEYEECWTLSEPPEIFCEVEGFPAQCIDGVFKPSELNLIVSGGLPPYTYNWSNGSTDMNLTNVGSELYTFTVTDSGGCTYFGEVSINTELEELQVSSIQQNISCDGSNAFGAIDLSVTGGTPPYNYTWSDNAPDPSIEDQSGLEEGSYNVTVGDADGCQFVTLEFSIMTEGVPLAPNLCLVTNDNPQGYNTLYWEGDESNGDIAKYNIYREGDVSEEFEVIGTVAVDQVNTFRDEEALSTQQAYRYFVKAVNSCDVESEPSDIHKTIHLTINQGTNGNINLIWDEYEGVTYEQVTIYRGDNPDNLLEYTTLPGNIFSFTDLDAIGGTSYYQIGLTLSIGCDIAKGTYELKSNIAENVPSSVNEVDWIETIYPNPFEEKLHVMINNKATIEFIDFDGKVLMKKKMNQGANSIETNLLRSGMYFVRLTSGNQIVTWRGIKP